MLYDIKQCSGMLLDHSGTFFRKYRRIDYGFMRRQVVSMTLHGPASIIPGSKPGPILSRAAVPAFQVVVGVRVRHTQADNRTHMYQIISTRSRINVARVDFHSGCQWKVWKRGFCTHERYVPYTAGVMGTAS